MRSSARAAPRRAASQSSSRREITRAFTLIEIVAGVAIFLIAVTSIMSLFGVALDAHKTQVDRMAAAMVAQRAFAQIKAFPPSDVVPMPPDFPSLPSPGGWYLTPSATPIPATATRITLDPSPSASPLLPANAGGALAISAQTGLFWLPEQGRPTYALIKSVDSTGGPQEEWISFEGFQQSPPALLGVTRGALGTTPVTHNQKSSTEPPRIWPTFYFADYPTYRFRLQSRQYTNAGIPFNVVDIIVMWNEVNRPHEITFSYALFDQTQFDLTGTGVSFPP